MVEIQVRSLADVPSVSQGWIYEEITAVDRDSTSTLLQLLVNIVLLGNTTALLLKVQTY